MAQGCSYRLCRLIKMILLYSSGTPYMDPKSRTAKSVLKKPDLERRELQEYREVWRQSWWSMGAIVVWTLYLDIKYLFVIMLTLNSADHSEPERNIRRVATSDGSFQFRFNCLMSNCSKPLAGPKAQGLGHDFKRVPHMWLCHPGLAASGQFSPWDLLDTQTLLNQAALIIFITIEGILYPTFQAAYAAPNEALMFLLAPKVTTSLVCDKLVQLYQELRLSYLNFRSVGLQLQRDRGGGPALWSRRHEFATEGPTRSLRLSIRLNSGQLRAYARDCLPAVRQADWWRPRAAYVMSFVFVFMVLVSLVVEAAYTGTTLMVVERHRSTMAAYARELVAQKCNIWMADTSEPVDLERPILNYNLYNVLEYSIFFTGIAIVISSILCLYYLLVVELNLWVRELELKLALAIEILRLQSIVSGTTGRQERPISGKLERAIFNLGQVRDGIIKSSHTNAIGLVSFGSQKCGSSQSFTDTKLAHQMYALKLLHEHQQGAHIECIEKVYLSFRLFMDLVEQYGRLTAPLIFLAHVLTYSFAAVGVYYTLNIRDLTFEALLLAFVLMLVVAVFIQIGAAFHSNAMRLSPLVWSLMAQISHTTDPKLEHLLLLWSKLHALINNEGGIFLKALSRRFDYFEIVRLTVGTSTIMILAMKN